MCCRVSFNLLNEPLQPLARHQGAAHPGAAAAPRQGPARAEGAAGCPRSEAPPQDQTGTAARAGSSQDARSVSRAPGAQLPAPDLPGDLPQPVPGMAAAQDCSRAGSRAPEAAATPPGSSPGCPEAPRRVHDKKRIFTDEETPENYICGCPC